MQYSFIAEKVFYNVNIDTEIDNTDCRLELLTGDFNDNNYDEIINALEHIDYCPDECDSVANKVLAAIRECWDNPGTIEHTGVTVTIEREESEPDFNYSGCDVCRDGLGNNVYSCIGYNDAGEIKNGEYWEIDVCADCLCSYHNGE